MNLITQAAYIAAHAHRAQIYGDKCYFDGHLMPTAEIAGRIATSIKMSDPDAAITVALLHDIIEDKHATKSGLARALTVVSPKHNAEWIAECSSRLARDKKRESYEEYIQRLIDIPHPVLRTMVLVVKASDLICHITSGPPKSLEKRYHKALHKISIALPEATTALNQELLNRMAQ